MTDRLFSSGFGAGYSENLPVWQRARDFIAGEHAVKCAGVRYLPRLEGQTDAEYAAYVERAGWSDWAGGALIECLGAIFRRSPEVVCPDTVRGWIGDCDGGGLGFVKYCRQVLEEVLSVGRGASLLDVGGHVRFVRAEDLLEWETGQVGGELRLVRVVIRDGEQRIELRLMDGASVRQVWSPPEVQGGEWVLKSREALSSRGVALPFLPVVFHSPVAGLGAEITRAPLAGVIGCCLDHYRLSADYRHGLHLASLPTAWVAGFDKGSELRVGASVAWVSEIPGATAGYLEFKGTGLSHVERAIEKVEERLTGLVDVLLGRKGAGAGLAGVVESLNSSLSRVMEMAHRCISGDGHSACVVKMNTDFGASALAGADLLAVVNAWRGGAISRESMLEILKRGEVLPDGRSVEREKALLHRSCGVDVG